MARVWSPVPSFLMPSRVATRKLPGLASAYCGRDLTNSRLLLPASKPSALAGALTGPNWAAPVEPLYRRPVAQRSMVEEPEVPASREAPFSIWTTCATLEIWRLSRTMLGDWTSSLVRMPMGVLLMEESITEMEPIPWPVLPPWPLMLKAMALSLTSICLWDEGCQLRARCVKGS